MLTRVVSIEKLSWEREPSPVMRVTTSELQGQRDIGREASGWVRSDLCDKYVTSVCHKHVVTIIVTSTAPRHYWSAVVEWLASQTLDLRVVRSNPGLSITRACPRLVSMPGEVKDPTLVVQNVTCSGGLTQSSISWWHWLWTSCAHHRMYLTDATLYKHNKY